MRHMIGFIVVPTLSVVSSCSHTSITLNWADAGTIAILVRGSQKSRYCCVDLDERVVLESDLRTGMTGELGAFRRLQLVDGSPRRDPGMFVHWTFFRVLLYSIATVA